MNTETQVLDAPWSFPAEAVQQTLKSCGSGLSTEDAAERLERYGANCIIDTPKETFWKIWVRQFHSLIVALLAGAAIISAFVGDWMEAAAIVVVVFVNALIGFFTELKANRSMDALKKLSKVQVKVRRDGNQVTISSEDLVPGDIVILEAGDLVPADMRIVATNLLQADESSLTGESLPIRKKIEPVEAEAVLADRHSMLFRSAKVTAGTGMGIVTATGEQSELGKISSMVSHAGRHSTPLEKQLDQMGYRLIWVTLVLTVLVAIVGIATGREPTLMIQTAIALAVAAIPEGLPVVATIALAHGLWKMAERNALINRLSAVETLGGTNVICTDKTGTLTENQMRAATLWTAGSDSSKSITPGLNSDELSRKVLLTGALCNNAQSRKNGGSDVGDPLEIALLDGAEKIGISTGDLAELFPREREIPFDAVSRMMGTIHRDGEGKHFVAVKGAPEAVFAHCGSFSETHDRGEERSEWQRRNEQLASQGMRVIALAGKSVEHPDDDPFSDLEFHGLVGLIDPPRADVPAAIEECKQAGVRIVMVTGDQAATAKAIANEIGLDSTEVLTGAQMDELDFSDPVDRKRILNTTVVARATPTQKLQLVEMLQDDGLIVAMTGDGVNDAPALKQADIGIAMGLRGTDVAREAAAMVLRDDAFPSIVAAIKQGRTIFINIRKFVAYLISCNISEIFVVGIATLFTTAIPLLPLQILFLNLVTDVFPALALGVTRSQGNILAVPPRRKGEAILRKKDWLLACWHALTIASATLGAFFFAIHKLAQTPEEAIVISFLTLALAQLFHVFNMASANEPFFASSIVKNKMVWGALLLCVGLLFLACWHPTMSEVLALRLPTGGEWQVIAGFASLPVLIELIRRPILRAKKN